MTKYEPIELNVRIEPAEGYEGSLFKLYFDGNPVPAVMSAKSVKHWVKLRTHVLFMDAGYGELVEEVRND